MTDTAAPVRVAVIVGSTRPGRFGPTVANWFRSRAAEHGDVLVDLLDLAESPLPTDLVADPGPGAAAVSARLAAADAFVVVTPEYNHSFPASLKSAIDWHNREWHAKPVGFVSYGGVSGGLRAVEQLRQVFVELHAVNVRDTVSFHGARGQFDADGVPLRPEGCDPAARKMLDQLVWWGRALRTAKAAHPYSA